MSYEDIDDLMQEAYFGLMAAVRGYGLGRNSPNDPATAGIYGILSLKGKYYSK